MSSHRHTMSPRWGKDPSNVEECKICVRCQKETRILEHRSGGISYVCSTCGEYGWYDLNIWNEYWNALAKGEYSVERPWISTAGFGECGYGCDGITDLVLSYETTENEGITAINTARCPTCKASFRYEVEDWAPFLKEKGIRSHPDVGWGL